MIRRSTLVLLTCMATWGASTGTALSTASRVQPAVTIAQAPVGTSAANTGLDITSRGEAVKVLQRRLAAGGYYEGPTDGIYGLATERAVRAFQADAGLKESGEVGEETWQQLQLATGDVVSDSEGSGSSEAGLKTQSEASATETAPTASELPADDEISDIAVAESEGGLGRVFGLGLGLVAVLASFGIGFFLANKDKADDDDDDWGQVASTTDLPARTSSGTDAIASAQSNNSQLNQETFTAPENNGRGIAPFAAPSNGQVSNNGSMNGQVNSPFNGQITSQTTGQIGGTSPLTPVDIIDGLIGDLRAPDPARRRKAIWELGQRGNSVAMKPLVDAMVDADSKEKSLVLAALSEIGIRSLKPMSKALAIALQDNNPEVRKNAIRDLTRVYDLVVQISQMLGHATEDEDPEVRQTAAWALEQLSRIRSSQNIDANVRSFSGSSSATPIDMRSSEASIRRSSQ